MPVARCQEEPLNGRLEALLRAERNDDFRALGAPFLIMEKIDGETIARRILREPQYR